MTRATATVLNLLCGRLDPAALTPDAWTRVVATARAANLLGSLGEEMARRGISTGCGADRHLRGARQLSQRQRLSVRWEAQCVHEALADLGLPIILLKGAAYALGGHRNAEGRLFGDIDLLVPGASIGAVELNLMVKGWTAVPSTTTYDQRYYREWMHEIPPLVHVRRGSVLDLHHTILPPTARLRPDPAGIIARSRPLAELPSLRVPCVEDLVIHSLTHLVHEGELHNGLRDLYDIHQLISEHAGQPGFFSRLVNYSRQHQLSAPVALGLRLLVRYFATAIPGFLLEELGDRRPIDRPSPLERLYDRSLAPALDAPTTTRALCDFALYVRAHWLRMPPGLLLRHLARKAWFRLRERIADDDGATPA